MHLKKFLIDLASAFKPININISVDKVEISGNKYDVKNGFLILGEGAENRIQLVQDKQGLVRPIIGNTELEGLSDAKSKNIEMLDKGKKVFTRSDIGDAQLTLFDIKKDHEVIIKKFKPIISSSDIGAMLAASARIIVEDKKEDKDLELNLHSKFNTAYSNRGIMIYNLFRSDILRFEVLNFLNTLKKSYKSPEDLKTNFLVYWDSILTYGYPTAYFVKGEDTKDSFSEELNRRFTNGAKSVYVFSRTTERNSKTEKWCRAYAQEKTYHCTRLKQYQLGFSMAVKLRIKKSN